MRYAPKKENTATQLRATLPAARAAFLPVVAQRATTPAQQGSNPTVGAGLPAGLKAGIKSLSGISLDGVTVHRNSPRPVQLQALAYAQGNDIHLARGQERHLPHEAWHLVQQRQGRVRPTLQMKGGTYVNDDVRLEREADVMGARAMLAGGGAAWAGSSPMATPTGRAPTRSFAAGTGLVQYKKARLVSEEGYDQTDKYEKEYMSCLTRGTKIWERINAVHNAQVKSEAGAVTAERFATEYTTEVVSADPKTGVYVIRSSAKTPNPESAPPVITPSVGAGRVPRRLPEAMTEKRWQYKNQFNVKKKQIKALENWADQDPTPKRMSNSEILWNQYTLAVRDYQTKNQLTKAQTAKLSKVKDVLRDNVVNEITRNVVDFAYPEGRSWWKGHNHAWTPASRDFLAVLGTPNGSGAGYILADHMYDMEGRKRKLTKISVSGSKERKLAMQLHFVRSGS
jgi:hypothetical protein